MNFYKQQGEEVKVEDQPYNFVRASNDQIQKKNQLEKQSGVIPMMKQNSDSDHQEEQLNLNICKDFL